LRLNFQHTQGGAIAAGHDQSIAACFNDLSWRELKLFNPFGRRRPNYQAVRSECCVSSWPGLKAAHATFDRKRIHRPIN